MKLSAIVMSLCVLLPSIGKAEERCGVLYKNKDGQMSSKVMPALSVSHLATEQPFVLPSDAPPDVVAIQCGRETLALWPNDYKYLIAGYTFAIVADERIGVLEIVQGKLQFRMLEGKMTNPEAEAINAAVNAAQAKI